MSGRLAKYLRSRAVRHPWQIDGCSRGDFAAAVVIPALAERQGLPDTLASLAANPIAELSRTLVLIVVNNRPGAAAEVRADNRATLDWLATGPLPQLNLAWVDASSTGRELPNGEGVGLARKIGFDLALPRLAWPANSLLISLDADTLVDETYLPAIFNHFRSAGLAGATIPFRHQAGQSPEQECAIRHYELYLRSYLFGLQRAGSPYAYHTIGSAFACTAAGYVAAGGMNRRIAAEDFYFLQQLAKTSGVTMLKGTLVRPSPRVSGRTPFGTGRAVQAQAAGAGSGFHFISAAAFQALSTWLRLVESEWQMPAQQLLEAATRSSGDLAMHLRELGFLPAWTKLRANCPQRVPLLKGFHSWFDGLKTRQLLQRLEPVSQSPAVVVAGLLEWGGFSGLNGPPAQLALLEDLQGVPGHLRR